jgi:tetratricopeptide (TPR) repeat protein
MVRGATAAVLLCALLTFAPRGATAHPGATVELRDISVRVAAAPQDVQLRLRRAAMYRRAGHLRDALRDLRTVARLQPESRPMRLERALVYVAQGKPAAARRDLDHFLATGEGTVVAHVTRAKLRADAGEAAEARADFDAALAIEATPALYLARAELDEAQGDLATAAAGLAEGGRGSAPPVALTLAQLELERRLGHTDTALDLVDTLLHSAPERADWILARAELLAELGREPEAVGERLRALATSMAAVARRDSGLHRLSRARVYLALGQVEAARDDLQWVVEHAPALTEAKALLVAAAQERSP